MKTHSHALFALCIVVSCLLPAVTRADEKMITANDLLKDPRFKTAYLTSLGPKAKEKWLAAMTDSAPVRKVTLAGENYQVATPCKPHDCGENNFLLLWAPDSGKVYGHLYEGGRITLLGQPSPGLSSELGRLWKLEFRQQ